MQYYMSATVEMNTYDNAYEGGENTDRINHAVECFNDYYNCSMHADVLYIGDHNGDHIHDVEILVSSMDGAFDSMDEWKAYLFEILCNFGSDWRDVEVWQGDDTEGERVSVE